MRHPASPSRRAFGIAALGLIAAPSARAEATFPTMPTLQGTMPCGSCAEPRPLSWRTVIPPAGEPGTPIEISGVIWRPDRRIPAEGLTLFVFHTDASGHYNHPNNENNPRLRGWMRTDADGRYAFRTINPGQYSGPRHIHAHLYGPGRPEWFIREFVFDDDPLIKASDRAAFSRLGVFSPMLHLTRRSDGVLIGRRDILATTDPRKPWPEAL